MWLVTWTVGARVPHTINTGTTDSVLYAALLRLLAVAEVETGGADLICMLGEIVAAELVDELGHMPSGCTTWQLTPWLGPGLDEVLIAQRPDLYLPAQLLAQVEVVRARLPIGMTPAGLETYARLRADGMSCELAYVCTKALEG